MQAVKSYFVKKFSLKPGSDEDPRLLSSRVKNGIIYCIALVACTAGFSSTIYFPGLPQITDDLNAPPVATTLTAALFILFIGIAPLIWASISEHFHIRRVIYLVAMLIYMATSLGAVFVKNIWVLVVVRCFQSIGVSSGQSVGAGYISDLYPIEKRGAAFGKYMFGAVFGPLLGPILGGFLVTSPMGWRATFLFCFVFGAFIFTVVFFFLPETYRDDKKFDQELPKIAPHEEELMSADIARVAFRADERTAVDNPNVKFKTGREMSADTSPASPFENSIHSETDNQTQTVVIDPDEKSVTKPFNPFSAFGLLRHAFVIIPAVTGGFFFGSMFATETILPDAFSDNYGLNGWQIGLCYLGAGTGNLIGAQVGGRLSDRLLLRSRRLRGGIHKCEDRLTANIWIAGYILNPLGLLMFGWVVERKLSFWIAIVGFGIQCFGNIQVMTSLNAYLVDAIPGRGAAATAASNFVRNIFACILTIVANRMVAALGPGWTSTLFACLSCLGITSILMLKIWGDKIRGWSGF